MLDAEEYTKAELADLFIQRWNKELALRSIKDVLKMDVLRCMSPEMVEKEIWIHLLAYNLIRGVAAKAAEAHDKQRRLLGFNAENRGGVICLNDTQLPGHMLACTPLSGSVAEGSV